MGLLYNIGIYFFKMAIFAASLFNAKARKLQQGQNEAFAILKNKIDPKADYVWFHAASLGEFEQGRPVIEKLKHTNPGIKVILTFFSPSGYEVRKNYTGADVICYLPLDTPTNAKRFIKIVQPTKAIFIKYEFWPNYLQALQAHKIPVYNISTIFRPTQLFFKGYGKWYLNLLKTFEHLFVQDQQSLNLLTAHGISKATIGGDTRFDRVFDLHLQTKHFPLIEAFIGNSAVIVAGSTWPKDEELLAKYIQTHPNVKLILAPHEIHNSHIAGIAKLLNGRMVRYTEATAENVLNTQCMVIDTIGMLASIYQYAKVAYIGGGFGVGIHNILEAAVWKVPVVFGPNYLKFREANELIANGGAFSISTYDALETKLEELLTDHSAGEIAGRYVQENTGATTLIISHLIK